jgi:hypothetical protein
LKTLKYQDGFRSSENQNQKEEIAADGMILDIDYNPERNEFGYSSSDKNAYIRKFSENGIEMKLLAVLQG